MDVTLHLAAAWTPSGRGRELRAPSASKSPNSTPRVAKGPLLEALSCSRGIGVPSLPPSCCRVWHLQKVAKIQCISRRRRLRLLGASRREPNDALGEMTLPAGTRVHVIDSAGEYGPTSSPFPIDAVPRFMPLSWEARSTPQARSRYQRVLGRDAAVLPRRRAHNGANFDRDLDYY